jgi:AraC-like DNA-binding protein
MSRAVSVRHGAFGRTALYRLDRPIVTHAHREGHLIFYVDGETALVDINGSPRPLSDSTGVAVSPWEPHNFRVRTGSSCLCLVLYIKPIWFLENSPSAEFALQFGANSVQMTPQLQSLVLQLTTLLLEEEAVDEFDHLLFALIKLCFDQTWHRRPSPSLMARATLNFSDFRVRRSLRLMQECVSVDVDVDSLARQVGLSRPHFFKLFKLQTGVTPNIYLNTLRSEQAIHDLLNSEKTVTNIAEELGFSSQASFTRFFSSNVGIAPSEYRRVARVDTSAFPMVS